MTPSLESSLQSRIRFEALQRMHAQETTDLTALALINAGEVYVYVLQHLGCPAHDAQAEPLRP